MARRVAEREGFEPPVRDANNSFRGYRLQPLGHLSNKSVQSAECRVQSLKIANNLRSAACNIRVASFEKVNTPFTSLIYRGLP